MATGSGVHISGFAVGLRGIGRQAARCPGGLGSPLRFASGRRASPSRRDGPGFAPTVLERMGEPYVTTRPAESQGGADGDDNIGLGLGFFIAKTLLERSGARLELSNLEPLGAGAVVKVTWPRDVLDFRPKDGAGRSS